MIAVGAKNPDHLYSLINHPRIMSDKDKERMLKGTVHQKNFYRANLIFWIVMGCGTADLGHRGP